MLTLRLAPWPSDDTGLMHVATSWQISTDIEFTNIIDDNVENDTYLDIFYSNVAIPTGSTYYGRAKRKFDNGSTTDWIGPVKLLPSNAGETLDIKPEVHVDVPYVFMNKDDVFDDKKDFITISTSKFRSKNDGHKATSWIIKNMVGKVLKVIMYDTINKTTIDINKKDIDLSNINGLIIEANHITTNDFESSFGICRIDLTDYKFEVISNLHSVSPNQDYKLILQLHSTECTEYPLEYMEVYDSKNRLIYERGISKNETVLGISREFLSSGSTYIVRLYLSKEFNRFKDITFNTALSKGSFNTDSNFKYKEILMDSTMTLSNVRQVMAEQFIDNGIPLPTTDNGSIEIFNYDRRNVTITKSGLPMEYLKNNKDVKPFVNIVVIDSNFMVVDVMEIDKDYPEFRVYDYSGQKLIKTIPRNDELQTTGYNNNLTVKHIDDNNILLYYFTKTTTGLKFRVLNLVDDKITALPLRPDLSDSKANLVNLNNGKLLSFNSGITNQMYLYDLNDMDWHPVTLIPESFRNIDTATYLRKDGKAISFNLGNGTNDALIFDPSNNTASVVKTDVDDTIDFDSVIRLRNGEFIRYNSNTSNSKIYIYK